MSTETTTLRQRLNDELQSLVDSKGGMVKPSEVVDFARVNTDSALHSRFEWDDSEAAEKYRLVQARQEIRAAKVIIHKPEPKQLKAYVHLRTDQSGYRKTVDVLSDAQMRAVLVAQAWRDLERFKTKYGHLSELADIFAAIDEAKKQSA